MLRSQTFSIFHAITALITLVFLDRSGRTFWALSAPLFVAAVGYYLIAKNFSPRQLILVFTGSLAVTLVCAGLAARNVVGSEDILLAALKLLFTFWVYAGCTLSILTIEFWRSRRVRLKLPSSN